jgi:2'-5' RNA ligase
MDAPSPDLRLTAVVHYPRLNRPELDEFRRDHDPFASSIPEHITLMFPVPSAPDDVVRHARAVAGSVAPFDLHIVGLRKTWDHWLYLPMREGRDQIIRLYDQLYTGPMAEYRREDLPFDAHIAIGFFGLGPYDPLDPEPIELDGDAYERALARANDLAVDAWRRVDTLTVVALDPATGTIEDLAEIGLE